MSIGIWIHGTTVILAQDDPKQGSAARSRSGDPRASGGRGLKNRVKTEAIGRPKAERALKLGRAGVTLPYPQAVRKIF